jgi:hypothetical protein
MGARLDPTPLELGCSYNYSQGSAERATLGCGTESSWDSNSSEMVYNDG